MVTLGGHIGIPCKGHARCNARVSAPTGFLLEIPRVDQNSGFAEKVGLVREETKRRNWPRFFTAFISPI